MNTTRIEAENPKNLVPHEDVLVEKVMNITLSIRKFRVIKPIIVDEDTYVILDGHHRHKASLLISLRRIPVIYVKYNSSAIGVDIWYRRFSNSLLAKSIISSLASEGKICAKFDNIRLCDNSTYKLYWKLESIERFILNLGIRIEKGVSGDLIPPPLEKEEIINIANKGLRFPPKTSRHTYAFIIPQFHLSIDDI